MRPSDFVIEVRDPDLDRVEQISDDDKVKVILNPVMNGVGSWSLELPCFLTLPSGRSVPHPIADLLRQPQHGIIVTGPGGVVLSGPRRRVTRRRDRENPGGTWKFAGVTDARILSESLAYGDPAHVATAQAAANDTRTGAVETLLHQFVNANIGPGGVVSRRWPGLTMGVNGGRGPTRTESPRFENLLELTQRLAADTNILFDVIQTGGGLQFVTTVQTDLTGEIRLDFDLGGLEESEYEYSDPKVTSVVVAGQEEGVARTIRYRTGNAGWGRSAEVFLDQRHTDDTTELDQAGDDRLADAATEMKAFSIVPDMTDRVYGVDFSVGDIVTVVEIDGEVPLAVTEAPIHISADGVTIGATVGARPLADPVDVLILANRRLTRRLSAIERAL